MTFSQQHAPFSDDQLAAQAEPGSLPALALPPSPFTFNFNAASHVQAAPVVDAPAPIEAALTGFAPVDYGQVPLAPQATPAQPAPAQPAPAPVAMPAPIAAPPAFAAAPEAAPTPDFGGLQPAVPYRAPDRTGQPAPLLTSRPNTAQQFVSHPIAVPQNVPVPAPAAMQPYTNAAPMAAPHGAPAQAFDPWPGQSPIAAPVATPLAAPAAPSPAPGLGLPPAVAAVAAAPNAWFGGNVQSDEALLVWNAAGSATPAAPAAIPAGLAPGVPAGLAASVAAGIPAGPPPGLAAAPGVAPLAAPVGVPAGVAGPDVVALPAAAEAVGGGSSALRWILFGVVPAALGIGIAVVLSQFVL